MPRVAFIALPHTLASSITLPTEMLVAAASQSGRDRGGQLALEVASADGGPIAAVGGLPLAASLDYHRLPAAMPELVILPALWRNPLPVLRQQAGLLPVLRELAGSGARICAVGTSSFFLAEAGLLDHRPATTHWFYLDLFARRYPQVDLKPHHLITRAGSLYCAGSVNSVADLTVHFVEQFYGAATARRVEAQFSPEIRRPFETHSFTQGRENIHQDELVADAQAWLRSHLQRDDSLAQLAARLDISTRSLNRRFRQATGMTPMQYLQAQRLQTARELLRTSNLSISEVAAQVGYQDVSYFCQRFKQAVKQTPAAYRKAVRAKLFTA